MAAPPPSRSKSIGHYVLLKTIGEGTFGKVKLGTHILTGERVAVKVLEKERIVEIADVERVAREIHILKLIRHPHIIQLYEIIETPRQLYLIMEYASGGELFDYIVQHSRADEPEACRFIHQILAGVEKVHGMRVVHRDLKPENLLLDERKDIKIADFGLSNTYKEGQLLQTACGSPCYAAPEMIAGQRYVPSMVDIWSCGVILFALVCGYLPFEDQNHAELYKKILNAEYEVPDIVSKEVADLISGMLTTDPTRRMTLDDVRKHVWYCQIPESSIPCDPVVVNNGGIPTCLDEEILEQLDTYGFPREYSTKCLQTNKHNHVTTTYYLLKEKRLRASAECEGATSPSRATRLAIADLDNAGFEDGEPPADAASMAAAVAAVATPSRSGGHEADRAHGQRSAGGAWLDSEGAMRHPGERSARPGSARGGATPREHGNGGARPIPRLNLNELPGDERPATRPSSARSGAGSQAVAAAGFTFTGLPPAAAAAASMAGAAGASCSRSPAAQNRPPAVPGSYRGGDNADMQMAWMPSPLEPRALLTAPLSARAGSRGHENGQRRRHSNNVEGGSRTARRAGSSPHGYGAWDHPRGGYAPDAEASPHWPPRADPAGPPLSARPRLQGNANGYRDRSPSSRGGSRPSRPASSGGRRTAPMSARGASGREGGGSRGADARAQSSNRSSSTFHVSCNGSRHPKQVTEEVLRVLNSHRINSRQVSSFLVRAQGHGCRLEAEVLQLDRGGGYVLRFSRISGDVWVFKDVCSQLLADLQI